MQQAIITREEICGQGALIDAAGQLTLAPAARRVVQRELLGARRVMFTVSTLHAGGWILRGRIRATRTGWSWTDVDGAVRGTALDYADAERALLEATSELDV